MKTFLIDPKIQEYLNTSKACSSYSELSRELSCMIYTYIQDNKDLHTAAYENPELFVRILQSILEKRRIYVSSCCDVESISADDDLMYKLQKSKKSDYADEIFNHYVILFANYKGRIHDTFIKKDHTPYVTTFDKDTHTLSVDKVDDRN